jgi:hypothetical protein
MFKSLGTGSHVTGRDHVRNRKYAMRMRNRKFRNTPSGIFSPEVTSVTGNDRDHGYRRGGRVRVINKHKTKHIMKISHISFIWLLKIPSLEYYTTYPKKTNVICIYENKRGMIVIMDTEGVEGCAHANRKLLNIPLVGNFHRKLATGSDVIFPRIFLSGSTKCCKIWNLISGLVIITPKETSSSYLTPPPHLPSLPPPLPPPR